MQTTIFCRTEFEGTHCYPEAPEEVAYLRSEHRHMFGVEVRMDVYHDDREVEFIMLKHFVSGWIDERLKRGEKVAKLGAMSCEQVAKELIVELEQRFGMARHLVVAINEDGENGAIVYED